MTSDQNHQLLIMRHAKSDWDADYRSDIDRPLSERGRRNAVRMARWLMEEKLVPGRIVSSPAKRTKQTVALVMETLKIDSKAVVWDDRIYEAGLGDLLGVINTYADDQRILLVGHNPGLDSLVLYLCENDPQTTPSGKLMTTAAIAVLDFKNGRISTEDQSATLSRLVRPKELTDN